ncbi:olfactory receptor 52K1-like [Elgaria multicarinata webbii]|uniref:olfactory receptor 52K1-like n=1 Tax=Elgaria multicarinata webbii TaxID=159646 RepID=UPI002FCCE8E3
MNRFSDGAHNVEKDILQTPEDSVPLHGLPLPRAGVKASWLDQSCSLGRSQALLAPQLPERKSHGEPSIEDWGSKPILAQITFMLAGARLSTGSLEMGVERHNGTANISFADFTLLPFPGLQDSRHLLAIPFFCLYVIVVTANSLLIYTVKAEESLHSPMYLLIALLLAVNICGTSTILPKMLLSFMFHISSRVSLTECLVQMFFLYFTTVLDCNILLMMALDRYVAVCHPLRYVDIMTSKFLMLLTLASLVRSLCIVAPVVILASRVRFCRSNTISHFACEHMALMSLSCTDISINKMVGMAMRSIDIILDLSFLLASYSKIVHAALKMASGNVRHKAFHTCGTHLMVIFIGYSSRLSSSVVFRLAKSASHDVHNLISAIYLFLPWAAHPLIYGVRTKEIRENLLKLFRRPEPLLRPFKATSVNKKC